MDYINSADKIVKILLNLGSISGLLLLPYTILQAIKKRPRLKFDFSGMSGTAIKKSDAIGEYYRFEYTGTVKNQSLETNSILKIYLVVWADNKKRNSALRLGFGGIVLNDQKTMLSLPIELTPKTGIKLKIIFEIPVKGTSDERLLTTMEPADPNARFYLHKYHYELCFEDTDENFFDQQGRLRNLEEINLRWTLPNTMKALQGGNVIPFLKHMFLIQKSKFLFSLKKISYQLGL
ncbi:MAG: hypothetical protein A2427_02270 [Candidatus Nealsonbacteria bacterium RIFOXYC1_FULL_40_7]|uniref:Uncharacterized protein n=2 Tax=Patescibacteria group TaxID=1783273 RepID=A0A1G2ERI4_9BACT|nr:MAG: hypothetical protein A2363_02850 [Candidatus Gottesmanbacteria bacterium RIFOXYB1_FULL_47_11]OGZ28142.1 MAG: hypothetical protein A2427_02270 [Candidatus Nealsonbacteria bacterium RIFOXYC1_FULL_40_7]